ncbi:hypothetical protein BKA57DRAFT_478782, partial [Linnemannia elongata]
MVWVRDLWSVFSFLHSPSPSLLPCLPINGKEGEVKREGTTTTLGAVGEEHGRRGENRTKRKQSTKETTYVYLCM